MSAGTKSNQALLMTSTQQCRIRRKLATHLLREITDLARQDLMSTYAKISDEVNEKTSS